MKKELRKTTRPGFRTPTSWRPSWTPRTRQGLRRSRLWIAGQDKKMMPGKLKLQTLITLHIQRMMLARQKLLLSTSLQRQRMREESLILLLLTRGVMLNKLQEMMKTKLSMRELRRRFVTVRMLCLSSNQEWTHKMMTKQGRWKNSNKG